MRVLARPTTREQVALIFILVGIMTTPAAGTDAASSALDPGARFKVESDVVSVPVVVIDKEGRLYTDLEKETIQGPGRWCRTTGDGLHWRGGSHEHRVAAGIQQAHPPSAG